MVQKVQWDEEILSRLFHSLTFTRDKNRHSSITNRIVIRFLAISEGWEHFDSFLTVLLKCRINELAKVVAYRCPCLFLPVALAVSTRLDHNLLTCLLLLSQYVLPNCDHPYWICLHSSVFFPHLPNDAAGVSSPRSLLLSFRKSSSLFKNTWKTGCCCLWHRGKCQSPLPKCRLSLLISHVHLLKKWLIYK